jgi:hypothetical protein
MQQLASGRGNSGIMYDRSYLYTVDTGVGFAAWLMWRGAGKCVLYCSFITRIEYGKDFRLQGLSLYMGV